MSPTPRSDEDDHNPLQSAPQRYARFGTFRLDLFQKRLFKDDLPLKVQGQALQILEVLVQQAGNVVSRDKLITALWAGRRHGDFDTGLNTAMRNLRLALGDSADNPRFIKTEPLRGYCFIAPIEIVEVPARPLLTDLAAPAGQEGAQPDMKRPKSRRQPWKALLFSVAGIIFGIIGVAIYYALRTPTNQSAKAARRSVAVIGFRNLSGRPEASWLSVLFSEEFTGEFGVGEDLRAISGESVSRMKRDLLLPDTDTYSRDTLIQIRNYLSADYVVLGAYLLPPGGGRKEIVVDIHLQDTVTGDTLSYLHERASEAELPELVSRASAKLRQQLGARSLSEQERGFVRHSIPSSVEALHFYSEGLMKQRFFDSIHAQELLQKAVKAEPDFPLSHAALASSWAALGYEANAQVEIAKAFQLSKQLPREERLSVEALYREASHDWNAAIQIYQSLFNLFPDNLDYGLRLAKAQTSAGNARESLATLELLRLFPLPAVDDPRIDLAEADAAKVLGDFARDRRAAASAGLKAKSQGSRIGMAEAKLEEGGALDDLGQPKAAVELESEAKAIFSALGDLGGVVRAVNSIGVATMHEGNLAAAERMYSESLELARRIGYRRAMAKALNNIGIIRYRQGNLSEAARISEHVADIYREMGDRGALAIALNNSAVELSDMGNLVRAKQKYEESLALAREVHDEPGITRTLCNLGLLLIRQGNLADARERYTEASTLTTSTREWTYAIAGLGDISFFQNDLASAQKKYEEVLSSRLRLGDEELIAETQRRLGETLMEQGNRGSARDSLEKAIAEFRKQDNTDEEADGLAMLAILLLQEGSQGKAKELMSHALLLAAKSEDRNVRLSVAIFSARVTAATGDDQAALHQLEAALTEARKYGYFYYELEAGLHMGEIELKGHAFASGRAHLVAVRDAARRKGFERIAVLAGNMLH